MGSCVTETLTALLLRRSEQGASAIVWARELRPHDEAVLDRLLAAGVLVEEPPLELWPTCDLCDCAFDWRPIQRIGDRVVAACPLDQGADVELDPDDLRSFAIDASRLIGSIAAESGFAGGVEQIAADLWLLGRLPCGRAVLLALTMAAIAHPGTTLLIRAIASGTRATLLAPAPTASERQRQCAVGIDLIETVAALQPGPRGIDRLDRHALAPRTVGPRLSIRLAARALLVDGTPQRVPPRPFTLLALLARAVRDGTGPVGNRTIEDATGRDARDLVRELRDALSAGRTEGAGLRSWIRARRSLGAFELVLDPDDVEVVD